MVRIVRVCVTWNISIRMRASTDDEGNDGEIHEPRIRRQPRQDGTEKNDHHEFG